MTIEAEHSYTALGEDAPFEARLAAARAAIAFTFGVEWKTPKVIAYLEFASLRLDAFAGPDALAQAGDEVDLLSVPTDGIIEGILKPALDGLRATFPMDDTQHGRKYWFEVMRQARIEAGL